MVGPYLGPSARRASFQLPTTLGPLAAGMWAVHTLRSWSLFAALFIAVVVAALLVRTFVLMHDCAHGSFFRSRRVNDVVGFVTGVLTLTPFAQWRRDHALHHASSGDLDRRGHGDVPTLTVHEYRQRSPRERFLYRVIRHPASLLLGGPFHVALGQRFRGSSLATGPRQLASYANAALRGSSHLQLPRPLRWFAASIGLHHVHHVAPRIPNYRLQQCHDANAVFHHAPTVTLRSGMAALRLTLWDEDRQRLVRFRDVTIT